MQTFGEQLRSVRKERGMTQDRLAALVNVSRPTISHWEMGRVTPDIDTIKLLGQVLEHNFFAAEETDEPVKPEETLKTEEMPDEPAKEAVTVNLYPDEPRQAWRVLLVAAAATALITVLLCVLGFAVLPRATVARINFRPNKPQIMMAEHPDYQYRPGWIFEFIASNESDVPFTPERAVIIFYDENGLSTEKLLINYETLLMEMESEKLYRNDMPLRFVVGTDHLFNHRTECILVGTDDYNNKLEFRAEVELLR